MWIYGGYDDFGYKCDDLFQYRFDTKLWQHIKTYTVVPEDQPRLYLERYNHTAVVYQDSMYIFGGRGDKKEEFNNDLLQYNFGIFIA